MAFEGAETASESGSEGSEGQARRRRSVPVARAAAARLAGLLRRRGPGLATAVAVLGGALLVYAETLDLYRIVTPSGSISNAAGSVRTGSDQHSWAFAVIGVAAAAAALLSLATRQRLPALAAAMLGVIALVVTLAVDLPDVTASGVTTDLEVGDAEPAAGFWTQIAGALVLTVGAGALAALLGPARPAGRPASRAGG